ncbi:MULTISPECIES: DNA-directed RNA polymerase subunit omega [Bacillaceae]|jgi:DNA-directed RNA polymerase subunit omega|uniref:DNA-directed RNA polymerase subunit omega n=4 Tax=Mesobacillus TaxID=2675231 RepID=A0A0A8X4K4_MESS1|nr:MULTISPECIES: DNA-directed RNA polymerase subunit omega [Bacillaceae]MBS8263406.1 DNA-directed RNA polymerase subunit omega [Mesobacillus boroniphilus]MBT2637192.1 DNA-directed RNA polymerase subunit omega [Bacillus sp. ISL-39]MBT2641213.1 DNA-directed RNA polymerase subunit omega [Bacillus sp. ISL-41]MBT2660265.1 DNA-directed RNA polymerase subunit omega [Bacillus sp. ISL-45]MBT2683087.1 DNA-directed RNA polymerase subunit omega [Bacillus sp. ISL-37]
MLNPSIDSLMTKIDSKYSLVSVAAKRARSMQVHMDAKLDKYVSHKFVGKALEEINAEKLHFKTAGSHEELNINE